MNYTARNVIEAMAREKARIIEDMISRISTYVAHLHAEFWSEEDHDDVRAVIACDLEGLNPLTLLVIVDALKL